MATIKSEAVESAALASAGAGCGRSAERMIAMSDGYFDCSGADALFGVEAADRIFGASAEHALFLEAGSGLS